MDSSTPAIVTTSMSVQEAVSKSLDTLDPANGLPVVLLSEELASLKESPPKWSVKRRTASLPSTPACLARPGSNICIPPSKSLPSTPLWTLLYSAATALTSPHSKSFPWSQSEPLSQPKLQPDLSSDHDGTSSPGSPQTFYSQSIGSADQYHNCEDYMNQEILRAPEPAIRPSTWWSGLMSLLCWTSI